ncbi:hypothetical protein VTN00DRAFT_7259 [Thermoascus crustaceus]|uniref:uncharacterized protein n=1 Tax=Thermoascus crustaceus TaxID=5088 RepID=UPI003743353E
MRAATVTECYLAFLPPSRSAATIAEPNTWVLILRTEDIRTMKIELRQVDPTMGRTVTVCGEGPRARFREFEGGGEELALWVLGIRGISLLMELVVIGGLTASYTS